MPFFSPRIWVNRQARQLRIPAFLGRQCRRNVAAEYHLMASGFSMVGGESVLGGLVLMEDLVKKAPVARLVLAKKPNLIFPIHQATIIPNLEQKCLEWQIKKSQKNKIMR